MEKVLVWTGGFGRAFYDFYEKLNEGAIYVVQVGTQNITEYVIEQKGLGIKLATCYNLETAKKIAYLIQEYSLLN